MIETRKSSNVLRIQNLVVFGLNPDIRGVHSIPMGFTLPKGILPWMTTEVPDHGRALAQA